MQNWQTGRPKMPTTQPGLATGATTPRRGAALDHAGRPLRLRSIGHLISGGALAGRVHSVFARAANLQVPGRLLTLGGTDDGPLTLRLLPGQVADLRELFVAGDAVSPRDGMLHVGDAVVLLGGAPRWLPARPQAPHPGRPDAGAAARLALAQRRLEQHQAHGPRSVLAGVGAARLMSALHQALADPAPLAAAAQMDALVGWGEGLTPAGDDLLVGLLAGLDACPTTEPRRMQCRTALGERIAALLWQTTPWAAQALRLALGGHHGAALLQAREAVLAASATEPLESAVARLLDIGATSGADSLTGLLLGLAAWWIPQPGEA